MTPDEAFTRLLEIERKCYGDPEAEHARVDRLLLEVLNELGYGQVVAKVENLQEGWWWA